MNKKKRTTTLIIAGLVCVLLVVGIILTNTGEPKPETVKEVMKDAVVHDSNKINFFGIEVNPSVISAYTVTCIILVFALILRLFVIPKFKKIPGKLQSLLEMWVGFFDNLAKTSSPHLNKFLRACILLCYTQLCTSGCCRCSLYTASCTYSDIRSYYADFSVLWRGFRGK